MKQLHIFRKALLVLLALTSGTIAFAQSTPNQWTAESPLVTANGVDVELTSNLNKLNDSLSWEQIGYNTSSTTVFNITASTGNWDTQTHTGQLSYELVDTNTTATLTVEGTTESITVTLVVHTTNGDNTYTFYIETYTNL